jgi:hypothetical protein
MIKLVSYEKLVLPFFILVVLVSAIFSSLAFAQKNTHNSPSSPQFDKGWFSFGLGNDFINLNETESWLAFSMSANFGRDKFWQAGLNLNGPILSGGFLNTVHIGRGISAVNRWGRISLAVGPSFVSGKLDYSDNYEYDEFKTIGITADVQIIFTPVKELGARLQLYTNLNL